jgi:hypothetical protein
MRELHNFHIQMGRTRFYNYQSLKFNAGGARFITDIARMEMFVFPVHSWRSQVLQLVSYQVKLFRRDSPELAITRPGRFLPVSVDIKNENQ